MQSLGHHCTSFSSPNFSSSERGQHPLLPTHSRGKGDGAPRPWTVRRRRETLRETSGLCVGKVFGIPPLRSAAGRFPAGSSGTVTFLKGKRRIFQDLSIPNPSIHIPSGGECYCSCVEEFATHSQ